MLFATLAAMAIGFQKPKPPVLPAKIASVYTPQKKVPWVFLGWGSYDETSKAQGGLILRP
jgi:hypothetical protein